MNIVPNGINNSQLEHPEFEYILTELNNKHCRITVCSGWRGKSKGKKAPNAFFFPCLNYTSNFLMMEEKYLGLLVHHVQYCVENPIKRNYFMLVYLDSLLQKWAELIAGVCLAECRA